MIFTPPSTHYGAPLANGVLTKEGCLVCPWHSAVFHVETGDIECAPALDSLLSFPIETADNGDIYVDAQEDQLKGKPGRPTECQGQLQSDGPGLVIVGGGSAAIHAVESARKEGYKGKITVLTKEPHAPYDRTKLSKALIGDANALIWRSPAHMKNVLKTDVKTGANVQSISLDDSSVKLESGDSVPYENLLLATGGTPKRLPLPGAKEGELDGVHLLRTVPDVQAILGALGDKADKDVVVIGSSFIGFEISIAIAGQKKAKSVNVVGMEDVPLSNILGAEVGKGLQTAQAKNNGLQFHMKAQVKGIKGENGKATAVQITNADGKDVDIKADVVVLGVGVAPATEYIKNSKGFPALEKDGSIAVDGYLRVQGLSNGAKNVFAAGDIATFPSFDGSSEKLRIEHWNVAGNQGRAVGATVAQTASNGGQGKKWNVLPVFWSALGGQARYVSDGSAGGSPDETHVDGNSADGSFVAYYGRKGKVAAVASMGRDPIMVHSSVLVKDGRMPSMQEIKGGKDPMSISLGADQ